MGKSSHVKMLWYIDRLVAFMLKMCSVLIVSYCTQMFIVSDCYSDS